MNNPPKPKCKKCEQANKKYQVYKGVMFTTAMAVPSSYWNEEGEYIIPHNPNTTIRQYTCSRGHSWSEKI